ncbi:MAG: bifunctional 2-polyprenyl-6-hydroxyphenol methylase/3-demethylubiquinol 3-O-methyltransferase UbiG [Rhodospirillaceae bacterium]
MQTTASPEEVAKFSALADTWWDPAGAFRPLHKFNPARIGFIRDRLLTHFGRNGEAPRPFEGLTLLDIGCGGGLIAEPMARLGFTVTAIDASEENIGTARVHAGRSGLAIDYRAAAPEDLTGAFDAVLALEVIEHVADVGAFWSATASLVRPGGALIAATLNRTMKSFALGKVAAEYVLRWVPAGTHEWRKFVRPSELVRALRSNGLHVGALSGISYNVFLDRWEVTRDLGVNYMAFATKPTA